MPSKREQILARVAAVLAGTSGVGSRIYRSRVEPITRNEAPALVIEPASDQAQQDTIGTLRWQMEFRVLIIVRGMIPDQVADPILIDVHNKILADPTLDGLVIDMAAQSVTFETVSADVPGGVITVTFTCVYRTNLNAIT
jgi:hypothetical protein